MPGMGAMRMVTRYVLPAGTPAEAVAIVVTRTLVEEGRVTEEELRNLDPVAVYVVARFYTESAAGGDITLMSVPTVALYDFAVWAGAAAEEGWGQPPAS